MRCGFCKLGGIVGGDEGPISGVAQIDCHGVKVGRSAWERKDQEEDGEVRGEVKGEVECERSSNFGALGLRS